MKKKILSVISIVLVLITAFSVFAVAASKAITPIWKPVVTKISPTINSVKIDFEYEDEDFKILVYRKDVKTGSKWTRIGVTKAGAESYTDKTVKPNTSYYYTIKAYYKANDAERTEYLTKSSGDFLVTTTLAKPSFSLISNMGKGVVMQWKTRGDASGYAIYRSLTGKKNTWTRIATINSGKAGQYIDTKVNIGDTYYYCFKAFKTIGNKTYYSASSTVHKRVISGVTPPQNFKALVKEDGIYITYDKVPGVLGYSIYRREDGSKTWTKIAQTTSVNKLGVVDTTAEEGKLYYYTAKSYKTVNGKTTSSKSATNIKVINLVTVPEIAFDPAEITFKDYYEKIEVSLSLANFEESDKPAIYVNGKLNEDPDAVFTYEINEKKSDDKTLVLTVSRVKAGTGVLKVEHPRYAVSAELKVNCPELAYDADIKVIEENSKTGIEAAKNAANLLEESLTNAEKKATLVENAKKQLNAAKSYLDIAETTMDKYEKEYEKYSDYKADEKIVDDYLDAVEDAIEDLTGETIADSNIRDAIRELEAVK